ncbi:MAG: AraC family transcriptional regulator [Pseudomonadota bacterium]
MQVRQFAIDDFIGPGTCFHFARKTLDRRKPAFLHRHDYYEVFLVTSGSVDHWLGNGVIRLEQGSLVFVRPDDSHALQAVRGKPSEIINIAFRAEIAAHLGERYSADVTDRFFWHGRNEPDTYHLTGPRFERAINLSTELQPFSHSLASIEQYLLSLFLRVVEHFVTEDESMPPWLLAASAAAKEPEVFRQGAAGFVKAAGRGHEHVCRMSRKHLGVSPSAYVNRIRMEHAALMLAGSDLAISEISNDCGIENLSHFYRVFHRQYGITPRQYRMNHQKNPLRAS